MMMRSSVMTTSTGDGGGMCLRVHHHQNRAFRFVLDIVRCAQNEKERKKREIVHQLISFRIFLS